MTRRDLSNQQWEQLAPLLPPEHSGKKGHPYLPHRTVINGSLWRLRTGAPWRDLPERYGSYQTCFDRLRGWTQRGLWQKVLHKLQAHSDAKGAIDWKTGCGDGSVIRAHQHAAGAKHRLQSAATDPARQTEQERQEQALGYTQAGFSTKIHLVVEGAGQPLTATLSEGQAHETKHLAAALDAIKVPRRGRGRPRQRPH